MNESLLVVEDTHVRADGLVLSPFLRHQASRKVRVRYETPDGAGGIVAGHVEDAAGKVWDPGRLSPSHESALVLDVAGLTIPAGTRIWIVEETG